MKKLILSSLIVTMLFFGGTANAATGSLLLSIPTGGAGIAFVAAAIFSGGVGGLAAGIGFTGFLIEGRDYYLAISLVGLGVAVLDENRQVVEFKSIDPSNASEQGLTEDEAIVYNEDLAIINLAYDEFSKRYNNEMTQEEATTAYNEVATDVGLSSGARSVLSKVFVHALEK